MMNRRFKRNVRILHTLPNCKITPSPKLDISKLEPPKIKLNLLGVQGPKRAQPVLDFVRTLFKQYNITHWSIGFDKAKTIAGRCHGSEKKITLSGAFVINNTAEEITSTIVHEIAHALDNEDRGYSNHDARWKEIAIALGDDGERCYSKEVVMPVGKFLYVCINCEKEHRQHKRSRRSHACSDCCNKYNRGRFSHSYLLEYKGINIVKVIPKEETPHQLNVAAQGSPKGAKKISTKGSKSDQMRSLFDSGITDISKIAKTVGAHYSHVHTVISKHKNS